MRQCPCVYQPYIWIHQHSNIHQECHQANSILFGFFFFAMWACKYTLTPILGKTTRIWLCGVVFLQHQQVHPLPNWPFPFPICSLYHHYICRPEEQEQDGLPDATPTLCPVCWFATAINHLCQAFPSIPSAHSVPTPPLRLLRLPVLQSDSWYTASAACMAV